MPIPPRRRSLAAPLLLATVTVAAQSASASCIATLTGVTDARAVRRAPEVNATCRPLFQERMRFIAASVFGGRGRGLGRVLLLRLLPGPGHVPHLEAPEQAMPPRVAYRLEGVAAP